MQKTSAPTKKQAAKIQSLLENRFGLEELRGSQKEVIDAVLRGEDTLAILPTGAGKSLCFQLPALMIPGTTLVISPLIALMKDQQEKLEQLEIESLQLNSTIARRDQREAIETIVQGETDFIYTTPERLTNPEFLEQLKKTEIDFVVIDEAHCITQWGHDFRPAYLGLKDALKALGQPPVLALTATATAAVAKDIQEQLGLKTMNVIRAGIFRDCLNYEAHVADADADKRTFLIERLKSLDGPGIIYAASIKAVEALKELLKDRKGGVAAYHGQLSNQDRKLSQDAFMSGQVQLMIATNAFGMGIDKQDLRYVIHFNFPGSLEAYYQETGRAGRDGKPAHCILLYLKKDQRTQNFFLAGKHPKTEHVVGVFCALAKESQSLKSLQEKIPAVPKTKVRVVLNTLQKSGLVLTSTKGAKLSAEGLRLIGNSAARIESELTAVAKTYEENAATDRDKLKHMVMYAQTALCRWNTLLKYFGEAPLEPGCGICDNCERKH